MPETGASSFHPHEAAIAHAMVQQASCTLLLADHSKLGVISRTQYAPVGDIDLLICDGGAAKPGALSALQQALAVQVV